MTIPPLSMPSIPATGVSTGQTAAPGQTAATGPAAAPQTAPAPAQVQAQAPNPLQSALAAARQDAAVTQNGLASLMANVLQASVSGNLPPAVQSAVQQLLALHLQTGKQPDTAAVKSAMLASGLFNEALLAEGAAPPANLKSALTRLSQAAGRWLAKTPAQNQPQVQAPVAAVPPPVRGGQPVAQGVQTPGLPEDADPALIAKLLVTGSEAALARQTLLQMASLPDDAKPGETRWIFDVPLMTPHGAAVAQMFIERDGRGTSPESPEPVWRVGLAVDIEPLGPVRANLALSGGHAWVTIGAERPESLRKLERDSAWLGDALALVAEQTDIAFQSANNGGTRYGRLVDNAT